MPHLSLDGAARAGDTSPSPRLQLPKGREASLPLDLDFILSLDQSPSPLLGHPSCWPHEALIVGTWETGRLEGRCLFSLLFAALGSSCTQAHQNPRHGCVRELGGAVTPSPGSLLGTGWKEGLSFSLVYPGLRPVSLQV